MLQQFLPVPLRYDGVLLMQGLSDSRREALGIEDKISQLLGRLTCRVDPLL